MTTKKRTETKTVRAVRCVPRAAVVAADGTRRLRRSDPPRRRPRRRPPVRPRLLKLQPIFRLRRRRRRRRHRRIGTRHQFSNRPCVARAGAYGAKSAVTRWTFSRAPTLGEAYRLPTCT